VEWFVAVVVIIALGVAAVAASGGLGEMSKEPVRDVYRQDLPVDRALRAGDISRLRFGVTLRGYAMGQVDDVLDRLAREIAERDALIERLQGQLASHPEIDAEEAQPADTAAEVAPHEVVPDASTVSPTVSQR
jgi:DivIVA domain-containing protein